MKLSLLPVSFFPEIRSGSMTITQCAEIASAEGFQGIDLSPILFNYKSFSEIRHIRESVHSVGLEIGMLTSYPDFTNPSSKIREDEIKHVVDMIGTAAELNAQFLRLTAGQNHPETRRKEGIEWVVESLHKVIEHGRKASVELVFENHSKPGIWQYYDFAYDSEIFLEIAEKTADCNLGILFDTANTVARGDDPMHVLQQVAGRVRYVHASDTKASGEGFQPVLLGTGAVPFHIIFSCLHKTGYDGWISLEECSRMGTEGVKKAVEFVRHTWEKSLYGPDHSGC